MTNLIHRGVQGVFLENTYDALQYSFLIDNFNGFETDIRLTRDGTWIIFHDENLKNLTYQNMKVDEIKYKNIGFMKYNNNLYNVLKLKDIKNFNYPNKLINLEIKVPFNIKNKYKKKLKKIVSKFRTPILFSSFKWEWYDWCKKNNFRFAHLINNTYLPNKGSIWIFDYNLLKENKIKYIPNNIEIGYYSDKLEDDKNDYSIKICDYYL